MTKLSGTQKALVGMVAGGAGLFLTSALIGLAVNADRPAPRQAVSQSAQAGLPPELQVTEEAKPTHAIILEGSTPTRVSIDWRVGFDQDKRGAVVLDAGEDFRKEIPLDSIPSSVFFSVVPVDVNLDSPDVTCRIILDGVVVDESTGMFGGICHL